MLGVLKVCPNEVFYFPCCEIFCSNCLKVVHLYRFAVDFRRDSGDRLRFAVPPVALDLRFGDGTLPPFERASDNPIAIACFGSVTF